MVPAKLEPCSFTHLNPQVYSLYCVHLAPQNVQFLQRIWDICPWWWCLAGTSLLISRSEGDPAPTSFWWLWEPFLPHHPTSFVQQFCPLLPQDCWSHPPCPTITKCLLIWWIPSLQSGCKSTNRVPLDPKPCQQHQFYSHFLFSPIILLLLALFALTTAHVMKLLWRCFCQELLQDCAGKALLIPS